MVTLQTAPSYTTINTPEGFARTFVRPSGGLEWIAIGSADALTQAGGVWLYRRADDDAVLAFTADGKLQTRTERGGFTYTYAYDGSGRLATVSNPFGRSLVFAYAGNKLATVTTPDGRVIGYTYDASGRLATVLYPDGKSRGFLYENASFPQALTGIIDESGVRWGTFAYDSSGRAISTELAGGVNKYQVSYPSSSSATVIDPLNTSRSYSYATNKGKLAVTGGSLPSGEGESDASSRVQDANGLITSETDFKGVTTTTQWDVARRLPTSVTEASGTPDARTTTTQWHATMALPILVSEPGRSTAYTYDSAGRVLTKSITDTLVTPSTTKTWTWTYTAQGLVATEQAPNGAVTSYTYDTKGNVLTATNALGHVTGYAYDNANRVISQTEPNGLVTTYTWDARDRLLTQTVGGTQTTTLTYNPTGTLATLTLPTGLSLTYTYDNAHRLTGWSNNRGESGTYTLDAMGNRVGQQIKNAGGAVAWSSATTINNLNRVSGQSEGGTQSRSYGYDANGERVRTTNALSQSTQYGLDNLRRTKSITNAANASASLSYNALDGVTGASDFKGVATAYGRDAQGNATVESSADAGSRVAQYDNLGLPQQIVDALGQATDITRDAIGRPTQFSYADGKSATLSWDTAFGGSNNGKGYLRRIQDAASTTTYTRDAFGRVTDKTIALANGLTASIGYSYNAKGQMTALLYPGAYPEHFALEYAYDATGRLTAMNWRGQPLLTNITWNALGQPTGWTLAFNSVFGGSAVNQATTRSYDTAGRLTQVTVAGTPVLAMSYDAAGRIASYSQQVARPVTPSDPNSAVTSELITWNAGYDSVGRLTSLATATGTPSAAAASNSFGYDANGNRTTSSLTQGGTTTSRTYSLVANTNRPSGFSQTNGSTTTSVTYGYNANGDLTGDGLKGYRYDATGRMVSVAQGSTDSSAVTRYAYSALGARVFKTEPLYPVQGTTGSALDAFFAKGWTPSTVSAEQVGWAYGYDEEGTLLGEYGMGGAQSTGTKQYVYLPTPSGPLPVVVMGDTTRWAIAADHLNTPRRLTRIDGALEWQWGLSGFGQEEPTIAGKKFLPNASTTTADFSFNLRYPGQTADRESGLAYNYFRSYNPSTGRYTQSDPIGLAGGWNRLGYAYQNPLKYTDPTGRAVPVAIAACMSNPACVAAAVAAAAATAKACVDTYQAVKNWMASNSNPIQGEPGCEVECQNKKGNKKQTRRYGADGYPETDTDWDHSHDGLGSPHSHDWGRPADGSAPTHGDRGEGRPSVPGDPGILK
ncbi:MAG: RHS repeat-associated core domain-containing protein [Proteobacteria bacterium]|nr:RHS repeat-associated core domain-containing protein [Pseudomonadota bacterium]